MITPIYKDTKLSQSLGVNLYIKRDDLYPITGGGSKGRKSDYILKECINNGYDSVVTCGGAQSNHVRATALRCKELGLECIIIIHDKCPEKISGNYLLLKMLGVKIIHCEMKDISQVMDDKISELKSEGKNPYYIWGGGHCIDGTLAYYNAVDEVKQQLNNIEIDYIVHASGTGTTQAGLHCRSKLIYPNCEVIGISVSRDAIRGTEVILNSVNELNSKLGLPLEVSKNINFNDKFRCGGYESVNDELLELINEIGANYGLILDPTYSGKAFLGLVKLIRNKEIKKGSNVIFWHTGGLLNLMSFSK